VKKYVILAFLQLLFVVLFSGCSTNTLDLKDSLQSTNATLLKRDFQDLCELLLQLKSKLDARNPKNFDSHNHDKIADNIRHKNNNFILKTDKHSALEVYHQYLNLAFSKEKHLWYRNDLLIVGIYKMLYDAYEKQLGHKITALSYDAQKMLKAYKYLQVIKWRLYHERSTHGELLFVTWQNNWQIELSRAFEKEKTLHYEALSKLPSIQSNKESFLDPSNMNFEALFAQMLYIVKKDLKIIGHEPTALGVEGIKSVLFFI
jgi:hypothetical protein